MQDPIIDRALALLEDDGRIAVPLAELAARLDYGDPAALGSRLTGDGRAAVLVGAPFPPVAPDPLGRDEAYAEALRAAGLAGVALVARPAGGPRPGEAVEALLRGSVGRLLSDPGAAGLLVAAARAQAAVREATPDRTPPSTTPLPGPRPAP